MSGSFNLHKSMNFANHPNKRGIFTLTKVQNMLTNDVHYNGAVLDDTALLKTDTIPHSNEHVINYCFFKGIHNFRRVLNTNIFTCGQPDLEGMRSILNMMQSNALQESEEVIHINLRNEPHTFINGHTYVLRKKENPFVNFNGYSSLSSQTLEDIEYKLKVDIIRESDSSAICSIPATITPLMTPMTPSESSPINQSNDNMYMYCIGNNNIVTYMENSPYSISPMYVSVSSNSVYSPREISHMLRMEGYMYKYIRYPLLSDETPSIKYLSSLISLLSSLSVYTKVLLTCQSGRGRSIYISIILYLIQRWKGAYKDHTSGLFLDTTTVDQDNEDYVSDDEDAEDLLSSMYQEGRYKCINGLLLYLEKQGEKRKREVDTVLELSNYSFLRTYIYKYRQNAIDSANREDRNIYLNKSIHLLQKYFILIAINGYLSLNEKDDFETFMSRPSLLSLYESIARDPELTLSLSETAIQRIQKSSIQNQLLNINSILVTPILSSPIYISNTLYYLRDPDAPYMTSPVFSLADAVGIAKYESTLYNDIVNTINNNQSVSVYSYVDSSLQLHKLLPAIKDIQYVKDVYSREYSSPFYHLPSPHSFLPSPNDIQKFIETIPRNCSSLYILTHLEKPLEFYLLVSLIILTHRHNIYIAPSSLSVPPSLYPLTDICMHLPLGQTHLYICIYIDNNIIESSFILLYPLGWYQ
ncbi:hypothetical protein WA158_002354 [Blastocystis sp. Blastoise]